MIREYIHRKSIKRKSFIALYIDSTTLYKKAVDFFNPLPNLNCSSLTLNIIIHCPSKEKV